MIGQISKRLNVEIVFKFARFQIERKNVKHEETVSVSSVLLESGYKDLLKISLVFSDYK